MIKINLEKILLHVAYNTFIFPTKTAGKNPQVECMKNCKGNPRYGVYILITASGHGHCTYNVCNIFPIESRSSATKAELRGLSPPFGFLLQPSGFTGFLQFPLPDIPYVYIK
jgi:hypothetical protein